MGATNTMSTLVGLFKEVYGTEVIPLAKSKARIASRIEFTEETMVGNKYHQPVDLQLEHGWTAAAANASGPVTLLASNAGQTQDAQIEGAQLFGRSQVDYEAMFRAAGDNNKKAFIGATKHVVKRLTSSGVKRLEIMLMHGQRGLAQISANPGGGGTTRALTISDASWSAGIWAGAKGATLDGFASTLSGSKLNSNAAIVVTSVDTVNKKINVSGNGTDLDALVANTFLFWETFSPATEFAGLDKILRNTGSLFNIDASVYDLWPGNVYSTTTGGFGFQKLLEAIGMGPAVYELDEDLLDIISPRQFEVFNSDLAALRDFDVSYRAASAESGSELLRFHCQTGKVELLPHPLQKDGLSLMFVPKEAKRIGATDLTFIKRHGTDEVLILELSGQAGSEMRAYSNQAPFILQPRHTSLQDGITY